MKLNSSLEARNLNKKVFNSIKAEKQYSQFHVKKMIRGSPNVSFSPESGGRVNPSRAMEEISTQGTIRLKK